MSKAIELENWKKSLKVLIGEGTIKQFKQGESKEYKKGDVMIYLNGGAVGIYKCTVEGSYTLPTNKGFKKLTL